jgi:CheY-like chemotaxis protein
MVILLVEDDLDLAKTVELAFSAFGFHGQMRHAETVARADALLEQERLIDLVLSDMHLPDGTGLDVLRYVRHHPRWRYTPVLICSGDPTPDKVGRAYALGANIFIPKASRTRTPMDIARALHDHWLKDAVLPDSSRPPDDLGALLVENRRRNSEIYVKLAGQFPEDSDVWLLRALGQSNQANLTSFLISQLPPGRLESAAHQDLDAAQAADALNLSAIERKLERGQIVTVDDACECLIKLVPLEHSEARIRAVSNLFPNAAVAMTKLVESIVLQLDEIAAWLDARSQASKVRHGADEIRALAARLRTLLSPRHAPA